MDIRITDTLRVNLDSKDQSLADAIQKASRHRDIMELAFKVYKYKNSSMSPSWESELMICTKAALEVSDAIQEHERTK